MTVTSRCSSRRERMGDVRCAKNRPEQSGENERRGRARDLRHSSDRTDPENGAGARTQTPRFPRRCQGSLVRIYSS